MTAVRSTARCLPALDELDPVAVRIADEAQARAALADAVRRLLGLDALLREALERAVEVLDGDRDVVVAGAVLVAVDAVVVGQLEARVVAGQAHEDVDRLVADRQSRALLEAERLVEAHRPVDVADAVARVQELHDWQATPPCSSSGPCIRSSSRTRTSSPTARAGRRSSSMPAGRWSRSLRRPSGWA